MAHIIIVDDDVEHAEFLTVLLEKESHTVSALDRTDGAAERLLAGAPDLVILDVMFPESPTAGFDLARQIRKTQGIKNVPIILLTGVNREFPADVSAGDLDQDWLPVQEFLEKPVDMGKLLKTVSRLLKT